MGLFMKRIHSYLVLASCLISVHAYGMPGEVSDAVQPDSKKIVWQSTCVGKVDKEACYVLDPSGDAMMVWAHNPLNRRNSSLVRRLGLYEYGSMPAQQQINGFGYSSSKKLFFTTMPDNRVVAWYAGKGSQCYGIYQDTNKVYYYGSAGGFYNVWHVSDDGTLVVLVDERYNNSYVYSTKNQMQVAWFEGAYHQFLWLGKMVWAIEKNKIDVYEVGDDQWKNVATIPMSKIICGAANEQRREWMLGEVMLLSNGRIAIVASCIDIRGEWLNYLFFHDERLMLNEVLPESLNAQEGILIGFNRLVSVRLSVNKRYICAVAELMSRTGNWDVEVIDGFSQRVVRKLEFVREEMAGWFERIIAYADQAGTLHCIAAYNDRPLRLGEVNELKTYRLEGIPLMPSGLSSGVSAFLRAREYGNPMPVSRKPEEIKVSFDEGTQAFALEFL